MSFNFGNTSLTGFGATSTPAKPTAFGNFSLGGQTTSAPSLFGTQPQQPAFGATPSVGIGATTPAFGFGAQTTSDNQTFGFGQPVASTAAFGFGTQTTNSTGPSLFGFGSQPSATTGTTAFGFGTQPAPSTGATFGFGQPSTGLTGGFGQTGTGLNTGFGQPSGFGTATGLTQQPTLGGFGGFGTTPSLTLGKPAVQPFGLGMNQPQQQQQPVALNIDDAFDQSIFNVSIFNDERDSVLAKWNYLQAMWGTGTSFYSQNAMPIEITPQNYLCRFKAMGYSKLPGKDNKLGFVSFIFNKTIAQIKEQQQQLVGQLNQILGNKPTLIIHIDNVKATPDNKCQVTIFVEEKSPTTPETRRIPAIDLANYFNQPMTKSQLSSIGTEQVIPNVLPDEDQLKEYLDKPPKGIDPRMWKQAKEDNPDPKQFIPVPLIGFNEIKWRIKCQENETDLHLQYLAKVQGNIDELKQRHTNATSKIIEHKRKLAELSHRILKIIVKQESTRKMGAIMSPEEETLRSKFENMQAIVSAPQFKGRLSELLSQMRMQRNQWNLTTSNEYTINTEAADEIKTYLTMQQKAMAVLVDTVNNDLKSLNIISDGLAQLTRD